jgi:hypothetical protein
MSAAAGAPVADFPGESIGARVSKKNEALRKAVVAELKVRETEKVTDAVDEAIIASGFEALPESELEEKGGKRMKGGNKIREEVKRIADNIISRLERTKDRAVGDVVTALGVVETAANELADASGKIGRVTLMGMVAAVTVKALGVAGNVIPTPGWGQLALGLAAFVKTAVVDLPEAAVGAAAMNPVVALAMATAFAKLYAKQSGKSLQEVVETAALKGASAVARGVTGQIQAASMGYAAEAARGRAATRGDFMGKLSKNLPKGRATSRSRDRGPSQAEREAAMTRERADEQREETTAQRLAREDKEAAEGLLSLRNQSGVAPPPAAAAPGGRRKTKKGKKSKRRVTQRNIKFAY